jgi:hypothetical protein
MTEEPATTNLEDNLPMVTYIMLHRIYDLLTLISNKVVGGEDHEQGYLLGPAPAYTTGEENG